ncbi:MAG: hypothetical protein NW223_04900 [Hyphomicrobiaceae bacterium]|nr:hypothetical protein [Hyphomicrobiaceae bacterium]
MVALASVDTQDRLIDRVQRLVEKSDYRRADTAEERDAIFRLRYRAYLAEGAIAENDSKSFSDARDDDPNAYTYGIYVDDELVSSIRLHVATPRHPGLPALTVFGDLLEPEIAAGKVIVDPTRFVADKEASRRHPELCYVTTRLGWLAGEYFAARYILATVRAEHQAFYRRTFGHKVICEPRHYPSLMKPISLMALDFPMHRERVIKRYPFLRSSTFERRMLFSLPKASDAASLPRAA